MRIVKWLPFDETQTKIGFKLENRNWRSITLEISIHIHNQAEFLRKWMMASYAGKLSLPYELRKVNTIHLITPLSFILPLFHFILSK